MGIFDFVKGAGEKLFGDKEAHPQAKIEPGQALVNQVIMTGLKVKDLRIQFNEGVAMITGKTASQEDREKIILLVGNTQGVSRVDDQLMVEAPAPDAELYTVKSGDTLSKIAQEHYGSAGKYMVIFDANKPMLKDPDRIYPGQVLRIPPMKK